MATDHHIAKFLSQEDMASCNTYADSFNVKSALHSDDWLLHFLFQNPGFSSKAEAIKYYFEDGRKSAEQLKTILTTICGIGNERVDLLEFASGYGMVTRHLPHVVPFCTVTACDIHEEAVSFIKNKLKVDAIISATDPENFRVPLQFQVVFALSFFSHMPKTTFHRWLVKLFDLVRPEGFLILTTHGLRSRQHIANVEFDREGFCFVPMSEQRDLDSHDYGVSVVMPTYVLSNSLSLENANLRYFHEGYWWNHQDLYVIQKLSGTEKMWRQWQPGAQIPGQRDSEAQEIPCRSVQRDTGTQSTASRPAEKEDELLAALEQVIHTELETIREEVARGNQELRKTCDRLAQRDLELRYHREKFEQVRTELERKDAELTKLLNSKSWRFTAPLRRLGNVSSLMEKPRKFRQCRMIKKSGLFDAEYYLNQNPDVADCGARPLWHFVNYGAWEGRNPGPHFDTRYYLETNPDVAACGVNPLVHYILYGRFEGRSPVPPVRPVPPPDTEAAVTQIADCSDAERSSWKREDQGAEYLSAELKEAPTGLAVRDRGIKELQSRITSLYSLYRRKMGWPLRFAIALLEQGSKRSAIKRAYECLLIAKSGIFDAEYYLTQNKDVAEAGVDPLIHFTFYGAYEGRNPGATIDMQLYCHSHPGLVASGVNPFVHYLRHGNKEKYLKRLPSDLYVSQHAFPPDQQAGTRLPDIEVYLADPPAPLTLREAMKRVRAINASWRDSRGIQDGPDKAPEVSIIIPVFNQVAYTLNCIKSILELPCNSKYEIIVVDDGSNHETRHVLSNLKAIRHVRNDVNQGFIRSCNNGAAAARGRYVLFLNNDTVVLPGWLDELVATFSNFSDVGLVGAKLLYPDGTLQEAGCIIWRDGSPENFGRADAPFKPEYNYAREVDYCSGACLMIPRELFQELGGFDLTYSPAYYEDTDLAQKIRSLGKKVIYQPLSMIIHFEGATCGTDVNTGVKSCQSKNARTFCERWLDTFSSHGEFACHPELEKDRGIKGRVLFIDRWIPTPDQDAGSVITVEFIRTLQMLDYKVTFLPWDLLHTPTYTSDLQRLGVECIYYPYARNIEAYLENCGKDFDLVIVCRYFIAAEWLKTFRLHCPKSKVVFHTIDLHYLREEREAALCGSADAAQNAERTKRAELEVIANSDCTVVVSYRERQILEKEGMGSRVAVFPYMYDCIGTQVPFDRREGLIFLGGYQHAPNRDAVQWFHTEIFPLVRENIQGVNFYVVGSGLPPEMQSLAGDDVILSGYVKNLQPMLDSRRLMVAPIRYGAGIKGKLVTGMSHGLPCVVSPIAAEGMGLTDGREVLIAATPESFCSAIVRLYNDGDLWRRLSTNGMAFVKEHYSVEAGLRYTKEILRIAGL